MNDPRPIIGFVYEWTNTTNGKRYVGAHLGTPDDGYTGSGLAFRRAWRRHGAEAFVRQILHVEHDDEANVWAVEERLIEELGAVDDPSFYNLRGGGQRGRHSQATIEKMRHRVFSPEHRAKLVAANAARPRLSPEQLERHGEIRRGRTYPNRRRPTPVTVETRAKLSAALTGHPVSDETRAKLSAIFTGRTVSDETRAKQSAVRTGRRQSPELIEKRAAAVRGTTRSAETRARMSAAQKGRQISPEHRAKIAAALKGRPVAPEVMAARRTKAAAS